MAATAICLDANQNSISCSDPNCAFGDCNSTGPQVTAGALCLDQDQNPVACADPNCTYGDCQNPNAAAVGVAGASVENGATSLSTPHTGGATGGGLSTNTIAQTVAAVSNIITPPPKTSFSLGASGLNVNTSGSIFSNPLVLILLAAILFLTFGLFRKAR